MKMSKSQMKRIAVQSKAAQLMLLQPWGTNDLMATAAVRYCLGRRTYIVGVCADWIIRNWDHFAPDTRTRIRADIEEAFELSERDKKAGGGYRPLGDDCDRADWERVRKLWMDGLAA